MNIVNNWKNESNHTFRKMATLAGVSASHLNKVSKNKKPISLKLSKKIKTIMHYEHLIRCEPADKILLQYELDQICLN